MSRRQIVFLVAKLVFAAAVITWLFHRVDGYRVWSSVRHARSVPILFGLILCLSTMVIASWRWHLLLRIFDIRVPVKSLICIVQVGQFFAMFLPGPIGDDLTRMLYVSRLMPVRTGEACATVVLDRCLGLVSLLVLAVCCIPWHWQTLATSRQTYWLAVSMLCAGAFVSVSGAVFFFAGHPTHRWFVRRLRSRPAHSLRDECARIWGLLCDNKAAVTKVLIAAVMAQVINSAFFYLAGVSVGITTPFPVWLSFVPIVLAANVLPITVAGIGVREYLLILFLGVMGRVESGPAFAASFVAFSIILMNSLLGGLVYVFYKPRTRQVVSAEIAGTE